MRTGNDSLKSASTFLFMIALIALVLSAMISLSTRIVFAATNAIGANLIVPNTCIPVLSNTAIAFGDTGAGSYASTANAVNVLNFGNANSMIYVNGGNWLSGATNSFWVSNTLWSPTSGANIGTQLANSVLGANTIIPVKFNGGGNTIFFGVNIPTLQPAGLYTQTINIMLSC